MRRTALGLLILLVLLSGCGTSASGGGLTDSAGQTPDDVARAALAALEAHDQDAFLERNDPRRMPERHMTELFSRWQREAAPEGSGSIGPFEELTALESQAGKDGTQIVSLTLRFAQDVRSLRFWMDRVDGVWRIIDTASLDYVPPDWEAAP